MFTELLKKWNGGVLRGASAKLARELRIQPATVSRWVSGNSPPSPELRGQVAKLFHVSIDELLASVKAQGAAGGEYGSAVRDDETPYGGAAVSTGYTFQEVPYLGTISASRFMFSFDVPPENFDVLGVKATKGERYATLQIRGDCMEPRIEDGDKVLIRETSNVADGTIAIVSFDGECTLKRVYRKKDGLQLKADNPKYPPVTHASNKVRILAEVITIMKDPGRKP